VETWWEAHTFGQLRGKVIAYGLEPLGVDRELLLQLLDGLGQRLRKVPHGGVDVGAVLALERLVSNIGPI
jgi:hypothetical protein